MTRFTESVFRLTKEGAGKRKIEFKISVAETINIILCFIMPGCRLFDTFVPFGFSAYTAFFSSDRWLAYFMATALGYLRPGADFKLIVYIVSMILSTAFMGFLRPRAGIGIRSLFSGLSLFAMLLCKNILTDFYLYDAFLSFIEACLCSAGVYMFERAIPIITKGEERNYISDIESVCIISVFALLIKTLSDLPLVFGLNIAVTISIVLLLIFNLEGEISLGAAMGVILGIMIGTDADSFTSSTGAFAFASMCSGILKRFGKWGVVLGFTFANTVLVAFAGGEVLPFDIFEVVAASVVFSLLPGKFTSYVSSFSAKTVHIPADIGLNHAKLQKILCERLERLSASFASLAATYSKCFENKSMSKQYIIHLLDSASSEICPECGLKYSCWERNYKNTYKAMFDMLEKAEKKGKLTSSDIPESFLGRCTKNEAFVTSFNRMFEMYKIEKIWHERLNETRMLVAGQLGGVATTIGKISEEFDMCLDVPAEKELKIAMDREGIKPCDIAFMCGKSGNFSVEVTFKDGICKSGTEDRIISVIEAVTGSKVYLSNSGYYNNDVVLTFKPQREYRISTGSASVGRDGEKVSGDSFIICENAHGETVVAISDGMGTGVSASKESLTATELLQKFISSGMDVETSLELINSSLLLRSSGESFATMDVCTVNLSSGVVNFSKSGAAPSYIKNEYGVSKIESSSLPFGILNEESEVKNEMFPLENSAVILMVSDGVSDVFDCGEEDAIKKKLENTETANPQIIASLVLNSALELSGGKADDDMTVVAISVWKN